MELGVLSGRTRLSAKHALALVALAGAALVVVIPAQVASKSDGPGNKVLARELAILRGQVSPQKGQMPVSSGVMQALIQKYEAGTIAAATRMAAARAPSPSALRPPSRDDSQGCPNTLNGSGRFDSERQSNNQRVTNTRVNQDCSLRRQAEETIAVNPTNFSNLVAGQN